VERDAWRKNFPDRERVGHGRMGDSRREGSKYSNCVKGKKAIDNSFVDAGDTEKRRGEKSDYHGNENGGASLPLRGGLEAMEKGEFCRASSGESGGKRKSSRHTGGERVIHLP